MNLEWRLTHLIAMDWDSAKNFQYDYGEYRLPTIKQLQQAFNEHTVGFEKRFFWAYYNKEECWLFDFKQGLPFKANPNVHQYVRLCKEIK